MGNSDAEHKLESLRPNRNHMVIEQKSYTSDPNPKQSVKTRKQVTQTPNNLQELAKTISRKIPL